MDKVKLTKKEFDEFYEVIQDLTQPKIEDNIDVGIPEQEVDDFLSEEETAQDKILEENSQ